jgi:hypothetical protein
LEEKQRRVERRMKKKIKEKSKRSALALNNVLGEILPLSLINILVDREHILDWHRWQKS